MAIGLETGLFVVLGLVALLLAARLVSALRPLIVNAVVGLTVFLAAGALGVEVAITSFALVIVVLGGLPGAVLVVLLSLLNVAFVPAGVAPVVLPF